jgi:hypothetical protein
MSTAVAPVDWNWLRQRMLDAAPARIAHERVPVALRRYPGTVKHSVLSTTPTAEKPALSDEQRAERLRLLAERLRRSDGLDRDTLKHIEQLTDAER